MKRKLLALLLALVMVLALLPASFRTADVSVADGNNGDFAQATVQGGAILHCFDWSYDAIINNLEAIRDAGYTAVQTSPVQPPKDYNAEWTDGDGQWWKLYQPLGFRIAGAGESWLTEGGKTLADLCTAAHDSSINIKVIVDVVANHLANTQTGGTIDNLSPQVDDDFQGHRDYFHDIADGINYSDNDNRWNVTQRHMGMPDLNTGNTFVQTQVKTFLDACIDAGVDGFRFDAAKHIELPTDTGLNWYGSDFWPTVLGEARTHAEARGRNLFIYGEILGPAGTNIENYTKYMAVTDNETGNSARSNAVYGNAGGLANFYYYKGTSPQNCVLWAESHDTYADGSTKNISNTKIVQTWAIVGARADSTSLYLARPNATMGLASTDTTWMSDEVKAINKFKNHFDGTTEYLSSEGNIAYIERGTNGVVISNLNGGGSVNLTAHKMKNGTYTDQVSGSTFTVSNGRITGTVGSTGVAVIYDPNEAAVDDYYINVGTLYLKPNSNWTQSGARFAMYVYNGSKSAWASMTLVDGTSDVYQADVPAGDWTNVIFCRMKNGSDAERENNWDNKWDQTKDLYPDSGKNSYTIADGAWSNGDGAWSTYTPITSSPGYYLVKKSDNWTINPDRQLYLFDNGDDKIVEYAIELDLNANDEFKIVYSKDGVNKTTWFPDPGDNYGENGNDNNHVIEGGNYRIYFRPFYNPPKYEQSGVWVTDWYKDCIFVEKGMTVTVEPGVTGGRISVDKSRAYKQETVLITVQPDDGYTFNNNLTVTDSSGNPVDDGGGVTITVNSNNQFEMPRENVVVHGTFTQTGPVFTKHAMALSGEIGVKFKVEWPNSYDMSNVSMNFALGDGRTQTMTFEDAQKVEGEKMCYFTCYINPLELSETITATMKNGDTVIGTNTYSALAYLNSLASNIPAYAAIINALKDYGHYMQVAGYTDNRTHIAIAKASDINLTNIGTIQSALAEKTLVKPATREIIDDVKFSLSINENTKMKVKVKLAEGVTLSNPQDYTVEDGYYVYTSGPIGPLNLGVIKTVTVQTSAGNAVVQACPMTYVQQALADGSTASDNQKIAMIAYYQYWQQALALNP